MKNKKVIWMLVLCLSMSLMAPLSTYADNQDTAVLTDDVSEEATTTTEAPTEAETTPETSQEAAETAPETSQEESSAEETAAPDPANEETANEETASEETAAPSENAAESSSEGTSESESESSTEESSSEEETTGTNEELMKNQHIVMPEVTEMPYEFRYTYVEDASQGLLLPNSFIYEAPGEDAKCVGYTYSGSIVYILADGELDWVYVESGKVRGFVRKQDLVTDELLDFILTEGDTSLYSDAWSMGSVMYNDAVDYTLTTGYDPLIEKVYAVAAADEVNIYDRKNVYQKEAEVVGTLKKGGLAYVIADGDNTIIYVESDDVRGFALAEDFILGEEAQKIVEEKSESNMALAKESMPVQDNPALHYTITSVKEPDKDAALRSSMITFAKQFVGNRYVWGGTDLLNGVDCSGFVQQVYSYFGYSLPRVSAEQSTYGMQIPISAALPGDLIFFAQNGVVVHVAMYIGDNKIVHAAGVNKGIIISGIGSNAVWATRIIGQ